MQIPDLSKAALMELTPTGLLLDRRRHARYEVKEGLLASPVAGKRSYWKMLDISLGGMSFRYIPTGNLSGFSKIDIVTQDLDFALEAIHFKVICDSELPDCSASFFELRRCGVQFGLLTNLQEYLLAELIRRYTVPPETWSCETD